MKNRLSALALVLTLSALLISGCIPDPPDVEIHIDGPDGEVDVKTSEGVPDVEVDVKTSEVIRGSGNVVTEDRAVSDFNCVSLTGAGDVIITQGEEEALTVETDDNLMGYIKTEVRGRTLILGFTDEAKHKSFRPSKGIKFNLSVKEVAYLELLGAGDIRASSLEAERLEILLRGAGDVDIGSFTAQGLVVRFDGAGDVELAGQVVEQGVFLNGVGNYRAADLESQTAVVEVNGTGRATVWATDTLDVRIPGPGSVEYYGDPQVTKNIPTVGRLVSLGER